MNYEQLTRGNEVLALKERALTRLRNRRGQIEGVISGGYGNDPMDNNVPDLTEFAKTCKTLVTALFDAEEKRLTELFDKRLSEI